MSEPNNTQRKSGEFVECWCNEGYTGRNLRDPNCPLHSGGGDEAEAEIARLREHIRRIQDPHPMSQPATPWIDVRDRLPERHTLVLSCEWLGEKAYINKSLVLSDGSWSYDNADEAGEVTHWMPLPTPPSRPVTL